MSEDVWSERDTTPSAIEAALRELLGRRYQEDRAFVPARVLNLVVIVERGFRGEVENRLARVGRFHPSRLIVASVEDGRTELDARAAVASEDALHQPGHIAVGRERVEVEIGPQHLASLDTIVDPLLVSDLATMVWRRTATTPASTRCAGSPTSCWSTARTSRRWVRRSSAPPT